LIARKKLQQALQAVKQQGLELEVARLEAENPLRVQAAEKREAVAKNEYDRAKQSRASFVDSVSESELDGLKLKYEQSSLEAAQAAFDVRLAEIKARAAEEQHQTLLLAVESARVAVSQAESRIAVAEFNAELAESDVKTAQLRVKEHQLHSKLDGVVVEVYRQAGDWVEPGEPVLRILRLNRLRAEAFVKLEDVRFELEGARAELELIIAERPLQFAGEITFVSPEIDPINKEFSVWMEFENPGLTVKPGMHGHVKIFPKRMPR
jgi:macrolide-specific efflux system membrane fusion protein